MESLVWYSIPGVIVVATISLIALSELKLMTSPFFAVSLAFLIPTCGFVVHQLMRVLFEGTGGFARKSRLAMNEICNWAKTEHNVDIDCRKAFLVWESAFYGEGFPEAFREHNRGVWHYILSFWGVSLACLLSAMTTTVFFSINSDRLELFISSIFSLALYFMFRKKGFQTYHSLNKQEKMLFWRKSGIFKDHLYALLRESPKANAEQGATADG